MSWHPVALHSERFHKHNQSNLKFLGKATICILVTTDFIYMRWCNDIDKGGAPASYDSRKFANVGMSTNAIGLHRSRGNRWFISPPWLGAVEGTGNGLPASPETGIARFRSVMACRPTNVDHCDIIDVIAPIYLVKSYPPVATIL